MGKITANKDGPFKAEDTTIHDAEGNVIGEQGTHFLCRCGGSAKKPFCDGTHKHNGFEG